MYFWYYLQFFTLTLKSSLAKIAIIYCSTRNLLVLYVNFSDKCFKLSQKWPLYYFQPILAAILVTIATIKVKLISDFRSKAVLLLWIFYGFSVFCLQCLCTRLFICALWSPSGKGLTSRLSFVVSYCEFVTFPLVSLVRWGT